MESFSVNLLFQGKTVALSDVTTSTTAADLYRNASHALETDGASIKLLYKGKQLIASEDNANNPAVLFPQVPKKTPKIMVLATGLQEISELQAKRSDPTIRGFDQEQHRKSAATNQQWGPNTAQDKNYKFCRFQACTWQSFGHRTDQNQNMPHAFAAMQLLEKLATDPGIVAIMRERELVVGTLGEMDPIDDRLLQKKEQEGACLLGYNTNGGLRIDVKLRTDDLKGFRPYASIAATLIHELSHNWIGEHNLLFWTNYGQMRAEYLHTHAMLRSTLVVKGKTTAELAGLDSSKQFENEVFQGLMRELTQEMVQHGLHPNMIADPIQQRCNELMQNRNAGQKLGVGRNSGDAADTGEGEGRTPRDLALAAAERRAKEQKKN